MLRAQAAKLLRLWSVVWIQRLVRRRLVERSRLYYPLVELAAEVALVREPGAGAELQEAKADASEETVRGFRGQCSNNSCRGGGHHPGATSAPSAQCTVVHRSHCARCRVKFGCQTGRGPVKKHSVPPDAT